PIIFPSSPPPRDLHSFPTRRSSDLTRGAILGIPADVRAKYATPPTGSSSTPVNYYFSDRGAFRTPNVAKTDLTATYNLPTFGRVDRKSTRLNSSHVAISYAVFCLKK